MTDTPAGRPVDPRFDPAFQPGYDPQSDPNRAARVPFDASPYRSPADATRMQPGRVIEPPRSPYAPEHSETADRPAPASTLNGSVDPATATSADAPSSGAASATQPEADGAASAETRKRNPFLVAMWILGVVFIAMGVFTAQQVLDPTTDFMLAAIRGDTVNYFSVQLFTYAAPLLVVLGLLTLIIALALQALRWPSRR